MNEYSIWLTRSGFQESAKKRIGSLGVEPKSTIGLRTDHERNSHTQVEPQWYIYLRIEHGTTAVVLYH